MGIVKAIKRHDGWSVTVAILVALFVSTPIMMIVGPLTGKIVGDHNGPYSYGGAGWKDTYVSPAVMAILELIALEILIWICLLGGKVVRRLIGSKK